VDEGEFVRRFWKEKWRNWHREHPREYAPSSKEMATWRNKLRAAIQNLKKEKL